jgi:NAD(P)-dependent dehydrogenase (short-subunit alcohol dehydrogenase family)
MKHALIIGASRGLGLAFTGEHLSRGWCVTATVRKPSPELDAVRDGFGEALEIIAPVDITDGEQVAGLADYLKTQTFNLLIINPGIVAGRDQSLVDIPENSINDIFMTNAISPVRVADHLIGSVHPGGMIVFMSSILGSISTNDNGRAELYRASKAALNQMIRSFCARHRDLDATVLAMHPGVVRTAMGGQDAPLDIDTSARGVADTIEKRWGTGGHAFIDYRNEIIAW